MDAVSLADIDFAFRNLIIILQQFHRLLSINYKSGQVSKLQNFYYSIVTILVCGNLVRACNNINS
jgi:hypothetical protein